MKKLIIYDFDGVIADSSHRYKGRMCADGIERIDLAHWIANEKHTLDDSLLPLAVKFKRDCANPAVFVVVATARIWCDLSVKFCEQKGLKPQHVIARRDRQDQRGGAELKILGIRELLESNDSLKDAVIEVYEDNVSYLKALCDTFQARGHYVPSVQGH